MTSGWTADGGPNAFLGRTMPAVSSAGRNDSSETVGASGGTSANSLGTASEVCARALPKLLKKI